MLAIVQVLRRGLHYAVDRPVREILYISLGPGEKYKSKPFIDTFVYRGGDLLGAWTSNCLLLNQLPISAAAVALSALWFYAALLLGTIQKRMERSNGVREPAEMVGSPGPSFALSDAEPDANNPPP